MAGLEAVLRITAKDEAGGALATLKAQIGALDKQIATFDKLGAAVGKIASSTDPLVRTISESSEALNRQRNALTAVRDGLTSATDATDAAAAGQGRLARATERATAVMVAQGARAQEIATQIRQAQERAARAPAPHGGGGVRNAVGETLPFLGPEVLHKTGEAIAAGATVQDEIARLTAAGAKPEDIAKAREDFRAYSRTHSGVTEADYLAGYRDARVIAPSEVSEMTELGARYRTAARNSGLNLTEEDAGNVMRIMDELGLKTQAERENFVNQTLKTQQTFGNQISTETMLSAYRNAKQSIFDWSPEFREKYFPTLLQSSGQQGGTEMMTALMNYVGGHMSHAELVSLAKAGFVNESDIIWNRKTGEAKGVKPGAQLFEKDLFKSNVFDWAIDFHNQFMKRHGATESKFSDLLAVMPRNMGSLIAFLVHNEQRLRRDASTRETAVGDAAASDTFLANNPGAAFDALKASIEQLAASVTGPTMEATAQGLAAVARGIQQIADAAGDFSAKHPDAAKALGFGAESAALGTGGWLTWKLFTGVSRLLGFGGGAGEAAGTAGGFGFPALSGTIGTIGGVAGVPLFLYAAGEAANPTTPEGAKYRTDTAWPTQTWDIERARRAEAEWRADPEAAHARALGGLSGGESRPVEVSGSVTGEVTGRAELAVTINASPEFVAQIEAMRQATQRALDLSGQLTGRMGQDAGPRRSVPLGFGGVGRM